MADNTDIPEIEDSGSSGEQEKATEVLVLPEQTSPFGNEPIAETMQGLASSNARSLGGEVAASLISATYTQITNSLSEMKDDLKRTRQELSVAKDKLADCKVESAVLKERVASSKSSRHMRSMGIFVGTSLVAIGITLGGSNFDTLAKIIGGLGILLILMGWFWPSPGGQK